MQAHVSKIRPEQWFLIFSVCIKNIKESIDFLFVLFNDFEYISFLLFVFVKPQESKTFLDLLHKHKNF